MMVNQSNSAYSASVVHGPADASVWVRCFGRLAGRGLIWPFLLMIVALLVSPELSSAAQLKWTLWLSFGIAALSLDFVWGKAGIFSFGQNALFGIGGYAYAVIAINLFPVTMETGTALIGAAVAAAVFSLILGYIMFYGRVGDVYLAIVTLAVTLALYTIMSSTAGPDYRIGEALLGGFNGMPSVPSIALGMPGDDGNAEFDTIGLLKFAIVLATVLYVFLRYLSTGRFGSILVGLRENETRMELLGYDTRRYKLLAFTLGGAIAGIGGGLFAAWGMFINPSVFALGQAAMIVIWVIVGGRGTLGGAFLGVVLVQWIADEADNLVSQQTPLILGILLILMVLLLPGGVISVIRKILQPVFEKFSVFSGTATGKIDEGLVASRRSADRGAGSEEYAAPRVASMAVSEVTKSFGGLSVLRGVSLNLTGPGVYAIIGANGAGKTTLFGVLTGYHQATSGGVELNGHDVSQAPPYKRARLGLGIKMQVPSLCPELTVRQNMDLSIHASRGQKLSEHALAALRIGGLQDKLNVIVSTLPHGEKQWLEISMVLAQDPSVILLDEPAAGMTKLEREKMVSLIATLAKSYTVIIVEHDMSFIRSLNSPVAMLHKGQVFRYGTFAEVCTDPEVIDAYLGRNHVAAS